MKLISLIGATVASIVALGIGTAILRFVFFGLFGIVFGLLKAAIFFGMIALVIYVVYWLFFRDQTQPDAL